MSGSAKMTAVQGVVSEEGADRKMPPGVVVEGPLVDAKFLNSYIAFGLMVGGSIAALVWAFRQGIGWVEISVFAGMFVHEHDRHRLHASLLRPPQFSLRSGHAGDPRRDRHDGGAGLGAQMGLQPSPAPSSLRQARRRPQPLL